MLLNFQVANWACFRDPMNFTMEAGPERDAGGHLVKIGAKSRPLKVLPFAAVYGNNASGKSQFIAALSFLRSHPEEARQMGENGRRAVREEFNWGVEEQKLLALYEDILKN